MDSTISPHAMSKLVFQVLMHQLPEPQINLALTALTEAVLHPHPQVRELAVVAIADIQAPPGRKVAALCRAMSDPSAKVRRRAARAVADQGPAGTAALPLLVAGLEDPDTSVRRDCAAALGRLGPVAAQGAPAMLAMLTDPETRTRAVVAVALKRIGRDAVPALIDGLFAADPDVRGRCATLLAQIAPDDDTVRSALAAAAKDPDLDVKQRVDEAMLATRTPPPMEAPNRIAAAL